MLKVITMLLILSCSIGCKVQYSNVTIISVNYSTFPSHQYTIVEDENGVRYKIEEGIYGNVGEKVSIRK